MRILMDYRPALGERTGVGQYVHELAAALQAQLTSGDALILFSSSWKVRQPSDVVPGTIRADARVPVRILNLAWHRLEWPPVEMLAGRVDIAHSLHPLLMPARRAAQVVTVHDLDFLDHPERTRAEIRRDYPRLAPRHALRADLVVTNSQHTASQVRARLGIDPDKIIVCTPGTPESWVPRSKRPDNGPILFVGTIEPRKNLPTLFRAYERLLESCPDAPPLVLAGRTVKGSGDILQVLERRPILRTRVRHLGYVTEQARYALYRDASLLVVPSLDEGFGMTALEAMHVGVPVIASNRGALPEVVGEAGVLVDPLDEVGLATAIESVLGNAAMRARLVEAGHAQAQRFTWRASARRLLGAYQQVVARRARAAGR